MTSQSDVMFELSDPNAFVRMVPRRLTRQGSGTYYDDNWLTTLVMVKGGHFTGQYEAEFMTTDFECFKQELKSLYDNLGSHALFSGLEGQLELRLTGDGIGHIEVNVLAADQPGSGAHLQFSLEIDQTQIPTLIQQLNLITERFPTVGQP